MVGRVSDRPFVPLKGLWPTNGNRPSQAKCVASVTNYGLGLETAMAPTVNWGWNLSLTINTGNLSVNYFRLHGD